jgi:adenylosuccinate synthase
LDSLVITKLDVLDDLREIKICTGYRYKGTIMRSFPPDIQVLGKCRPEYQVVKGWHQKTAGIQEYNALPDLARDYLKRLSDLLQTEISVVSTGPDRSQTVCVSSQSRLESWVQLHPQSI